MTAARGRTARALSHFAPDMAFPKRFDTTMADAMLGTAAPPVAAFWPGMVSRLVQLPWEAGPRRHLGGFSARPMR